MPLWVAGLATALPEHAISQDAAAAVATRVCCRSSKQAAVLPALYRYTGIAQRHFVLESTLPEDILRGQEDSGSDFLPSRAGPQGPSTGLRMLHYRRHAGPLALEPAGKALQATGLGPDRVTHLVTVSCTGFGAPGVDLELVRALGLSSSVARTHIGFMGCQGALNGLRVAGAFCAASPESVVLLCAVELCSLHFAYDWHPQKAVANALFADGAGALVGVGVNAPSTDAWRLQAVGSCILPASEDAMTWEIGDHGFEMSLSSLVPDLIQRHLCSWLSRWLAQNGSALEHVRSWCVHPGGPRILSAVQEALALPESALAHSEGVFRECGNMSSPTVLFILERLRAAARPCVALAFGPGLAVEAALLC